MHLELKVLIEQESVWLNRNQIAELFGRDVKRYIKYYNLDVIISVGYRVKSQKGVRFKNSHDRFLIIDKKDVYHIGASLKDLGKKCFAFWSLN